MLTTLGALALAGALAAPHRARPDTRTPDTLRVVLVVDDTAAQRSLVHGAMLGAEEASHTGALFGTAVTLRVVGRRGFDSTARASAATRSRPHIPSLYVVAGDSAICSDVMLQSRRAAIPVLDAGCALTDSAGVAPTYRLIPRAVAEPTQGDSSRIELWHWTLDRFGGEQLNERFRRRFDARMDSPAWVGWLSLKIALDLALHAHATTGAALLRQLADPHAQFDGQKGRPLRFAPDTHYLVQPVYRVAGRGDNERVTAEVAP
jgi:hypothetical protein